MEIRSVSSDGIYGSSTSANRSNVVAYDKSRVRWFMQRDGQIPFVRDHMITGVATAKILKLCIEPYAIRLLYDRDCNSRGPDGRIYRRP